MWKSSFVGLVLCLILFSCKTKEKLVFNEISKTTDAQLRKNLKNNELEYDKLYLKKVHFTYNDGKSKKSFKASFVIQKDTQIIVSIYAPMGIELIKAKLSKNELIILDKKNVIDKKEKVALRTDYTFFSKKYGVYLDFQAIQAILTNALFLYPVELDVFDGLKKYKHHLAETYYSFKSIKDKRMDRLNRRSKNNVVIHEIDIHPDIYRIFNVYIKDFEANQSIDIKYDGFKNFENVLFPEIVNISAEKGIKKINVDMKINYLEKNDGGSLHFKIPSSYKVKDL